MNFSSKSDKKSSVSKKTTSHGKLNGKSDLPSSGQLQGDVLNQMNKSFDEDFSDVKIHKNSKEADKQNAEAFTKGNEIHFAPGRFSPESKKSKELIGHELAHVKQQRLGGNVPQTGGKSGLENEADRAANAAANGQKAQVQQAATTGSIQKKEKTSNLKISNSSYDDSNIKLDAFYKIDGKKYEYDSENMAVIDIKPGESKQMLVYGKFDMMEDFWSNYYHHGEYSHFVTISCDAQGKVTFTPDDVPQKDGKDNYDIWDEQGTKQHKVTTSPFVQTGETSAMYGFSVGNSERSMTNYDTEVKDGKYKERSNYIGVGADLRTSEDTHLGIGLEGDAVKLGKVIPHPEISRVANVLDQGGFKAPVDGKLDLKMADTGLGFNLEFGRRGSADVRTKTGYETDPFKSVMGGSIWSDKFLIQVKVDKSGTIPDPQPIHPINPIPQPVIIDNTEIPIPSTKVYFEKEGQTELDQYKPNLINWWESLKPDLKGKIQSGTRKLNLRGNASKTGSANVNNRISKKRASSVAANLSKVIWGDPSAYQSGNKFIISGSGDMYATGIVPTEQNDRNVEVSEYKG